MGTRRSRVLLAAGIGLVAALAVIGVLLAVGGSSSPEDYESAVVDARDRMDFALLRITESTSTDQLVERIDEAGDVARSIGGELDDAAAPDALSEDADRLVDAFLAFGLELDNTAETFRDPAFAATLESLTTLSFQEWNTVNEVLTSLAEQGVDVEPLARHV